LAIGLLPLVPRIDVTLGSTNLTGTSCDVSQGKLENAKCKVRSEK
jgi:hypothetical protein